MKNKVDFIYKEVDQEGLDTLSVIANADKFNKWMFETIQPYCKGRILEIGSGVGNISTFFLDNNYDIMLTDIRDNYCDILRTTFSNKPSLLGVQNIDLVDDNFDIKYSELIGQFDTLFALNVIEHIENDLLAIANSKKLLKQGGNFIVLVPAYQSLYNQFDKELFHFKRYTKKEVVQLFDKNKFQVINSFYFNVLGILGWFVSGKLSNKKTIPSSQMSFYNKIVFIAKILDKVIFNLIGLSTIVVGKKQ